MEKIGSNGKGNKRNLKKPMKKDTIFKITLYITFLVAGIFLLKNIIVGSIAGIVIIGICLGVFALGLAVMKALKVSTDILYPAVSLALVCVISIISINSGESYSDDFALLLAAIALTGLYLRPLYPRMQTVLADILLVIQYLCAPEKAGGLSQYILCMVTFNVAAIMICLVIDRGRSFIIRSEERAAEVEEILQSLSVINNELNKNFETTHGRIGDIQNANSHVETKTSELLQDSQNIAEGVTTTILTCDDAREKVNATKAQIQELNQEVKHFEEVLAANDKNIEKVTAKITAIKASAAETGEVFGVIREQMDQIVGVMGQLESIAASTTMLALNASIEAARAGEAGAGFAVVASKVQELAVDSNKCSGEVERVVENMQNQVNMTLEQMEESAENIDSSLSSLEELNNGFKELTEKFDVLYRNIEAENSSVSAVEQGFDNIQDKISIMREYTDKNRNSVEEIVDSLKIYGDNMRLVEGDTASLKKLAETMEAEISDQVR